jgi:hypothetical protein
MSQEQRRAGKCETAELIKELPPLSEIHANAEKRWQAMPANAQKTALALFTQRYGRKPDVAGSVVDLYRLFRCNSVEIRSPTANGSPPPGRAA